MISTSNTGEFQPRGRIDVAAGSGYLFTPLVQSKAEAADNADRLVFIEGADVKLESVHGDSNGVLSGLDGALIDFRTLFSGSIEPGGFGSFAFDVVHKDVLTALAGTVNPDNPVQILASVSIVGTLDGSDVSSNTFKYPIEVCDGCMTTILGACDAIPEDTDAKQGGVCQPLQDGLLDCCTAGDGTLVCPAVPVVPDPA